MSASISVGDGVPWAAIEAALEASASEYERACDRVDAWRGGRAPGVRRVGVTSWTAPGLPREVRAFATDALAFVAEGRGASLEAATIDLAEKLPLPAPAALPTLTTLAEIGVGDLGREASHGETARPVRVAVAS